jgi:hypothetical protein
MRMPKPRAVKDFRKDLGKSWEKVVKQAESGL